MFFASLGEYPPCGMYNAEHFTALFVCIFLIVGGLWAVRRWKPGEVLLFLQILAPVVTALEGVKIAFNFGKGYLSLDAWLPLSYCSLFIYSLWLAAYGKGWLRRCGLSFLSVGVVPGASFLLMPSTSLVFYPLLHYQCLYSLLFHSLMLFVGLLLLQAEPAPTGRENYRYYAGFCLFFCTAAVIVNAIFTSNMMFLREPFNIPLRLLGLLQGAAPLAYTFLIFVFYMIVPYWLTHIIFHFGEKLRRETAPAQKTYEENTVL